MDSDEQTVAGLGGTGWFEEGYGAVSGKAVARRKRVVEVFIVDNGRLHRFWICH